MPNIGARDRGLGGRGEREKGFFIYIKLSWSSFRTLGIKNYVNLSTCPVEKILLELYSGKLKIIEKFIPHLDSRALCKIEARGRG